MRFTDVVTAWLAHDNGNRFETAESGVTVATAAALADAPQASLHDKVLAGLSPADSSAHHDDLLAMLDHRFGQLLSGGCTDCEPRADERDLIDFALDMPQQPAAQTATMQFWQQVELVQLEGGDRALRCPGAAARRPFH